MITKRVLFSFPKEEADKPIINELIKYYDLTVNLIRARITPEEEGRMLLDLIGEKSSIKKGLKYVKTLDIHVSETNKGLQWDSVLCVHCGNCLSHCPTDALYIRNRESMEVAFNSNICIDCLNCIRNCPYGACSSLFQISK